MNIIKEIQRDVVIITVNVQRATIKESDGFKNDVTNVLNEGISKLIINLSEVEFIDSTFLGILVALLKKAVQQSGDLVLVGLQPAVKSMFELTRMFRVFDSFDNIEDAYNRFQQRK